MYNELMDPYYANINYIILHLSFNILLDIQYILILMKNQFHNKHIMFIYHIHVYKLYSFNLIQSYIHNLCKQLMHYNSNDFHRMYISKRYYLRNKNRSYYIQQLFLNILHHISNINFHNMKMIQILLIHNIYNLVSNHNKSYPYDVIYIYIMFLLNLFKYLFYLILHLLHL